MDVYERTPSSATDLPTDMTGVIAQDTLDANSTALLEKTVYGVKSGLVVSAQGTPDRTVAVTGGIAYTSANVRLEVVMKSSLAVPAADGDKDRTDIVYVTGTYEVNDKYFNSESAAGEYIGWVCVLNAPWVCRTAGQPRDPLYQLQMNLWYRQDRVLGWAVHYHCRVTGVKKITAIDTLGTVTTVTLDSASDATVEDAAVAFGAGAWKGFGIIQTP